MDPIFAAFFTFWFISMGVFEAIYRWKKDGRYKAGGAYVNKVGFKRWIKAIVWSIPIAIACTLGLVLSGNAQF